LRYINKITLTEQFRQNLSVHLRHVRYYSDKILFWGFSFSILLTTLTISDFKVHILLHLVGIKLIVASKSFISINKSMFLRQQILLFIYLCLHVQVFFICNLWLNFFFLKDIYFWSTSSIFFMDVVMEEGETLDKD
jgi:hypothetical protein